MLMELKAPLKKGHKVPITLAFEKAGQAKITFEVEAIGASAPTSGQMDHAMPGMQQPMKMDSGHKM